MQNRPSFVLRALAGASLLTSLAAVPVFASNHVATPTAVQDEQQDPTYTGSIAVPNEADVAGAPEQSDQAEAQALASLAKITADQANQAALAQFAGATVTKTELDNENGWLVYSVHLTDSTGKAQDVKVDAGNGKVLAVEADGSEEGVAGADTDTEDLQQGSQTEDHSETAEVGGAEIED